ncbi:MAG: RNA polymerase sigma factor [Verrucomicrobiota bacterium]
MTVSPTTTTIDSAAPPRMAAVAGEDVDVFEKRLILDAKDGCQDSFRILVERHEEAVFAFSYQLLGCSEDAREACQDTFVRAYNALPGYKPRARFSTWLFRIALNLCRDRMRARSTQKRVARADFSASASQVDGACPRPCPDESLTLAEDLNKLSRGLSQLPPDLREALVLVGVEGLAYRECAAIMGCTLRAVEGRVYRARRMLLDWWNREA